MMISTMVAIIIMACARVIAAFFLLLCNARSLFRTGGAIHLLLLIGGHFPLDFVCGLTIRLLLRTLDTDADEGDGEVYSVCWRDDEEDGDDARRN